MSFSIGSAGANMGPRGALERFGEEVAEHTIDWRSTGWRVIVRLLAYLRPYWRRMAAAFLCMLLASALTLSTPYLVKVAIDQYITVGDAAGLTRIALLLLGGAARAGYAALPAF
ncbi:MAG: hypothetical protein Fur0021_05200 [Candidatus Promineifilaceae bacterium]